MLDLEWALAELGLQPLPKRTRDRCLKATAMNFNYRPKIHFPFSLDHTYRKTYGIHLIVVPAFWE